MDELGASTSSEEYIPDTATAERLVSEFAAITQTDSACAQFYLQDRGWDLERSLNAYFGAKKTGGIHVLTDGDEPQIILNINKSVQKFLEQATTKPPSELRLITWNVDGLDEHNLKMRTKSVVRIIQNESPDIVFLQEVIPKTCEYFQRNLPPQYKCVTGGDGKYFTATFINQFTVYYDDHQIIKFPSTTMERNLLQVDVHVGPCQLSLFNTHLESTAEHSEERVKQLNICIQKVLSVGKNRNVIFGGDLNLRDKELSLIGGLPSSMEDLWIACGSRQECQYTWDTLRNHNKEFPGKFKPRLRFDRVYLRRSEAFYVKPKFFGLIGLQKLAGYQCFPSDHWGIMVDFDIKEL